MYIDRMISRFREAGLKITPQRVAIFEYLYDNRSHPSVDEVYSFIISRFPSVSLTTVYNTLQTMVELGELGEIIITHERRNFDPDINPHAHIMCLKCKRIEDILDDGFDVSRLPQDIGKRFRVLGQRLYFYGICDRCSTDEG